MCEGPSRISGPIPPDPTLFPDYYKRPFSARGRLEGNAQKLDFTSGSLDPLPNPYPALGSARQVQPAPRIRPSGKDFLEKGQKGTLGLLLQLEGISLGGGMPIKRKESKDHEKENVRRIKEIQKKCKERERAQEHSQPKPVKALWKSQKYENVESKVKAKLQESSPPPNPEALKFLRAYSRCGSGIKPCRPLSPRPARTRAAADAAAPDVLGAETKPAGEEGAVAQTDGGAAAKPARSRHAAWSYHDAGEPAAGDPQQSEAERGAADKGAGDAASAHRHAQHAEEAGRSGEEALPDRRGHQNFLKAQGLHQAGLLSRWGWVCCGALREHPSSLGRNDHHLGREGEEGKFRTLGPRRCWYSVQRAAIVSCSPSSAVCPPGKRVGDALIYSVVWRTVVSVLLDLSDISSLLWIHGVTSYFSIFSPLLEGGRTSLVLLPVVFLVLFLLSWAMLIAHSGQLQAGLHTNLVLYPCCVCPGPCCLGWL
ncbi:enkurin domain-containing protein 1 isoform X2 [Columba livia]